MHRLLIVACSGTKRPDAGRMPARERYDGPLWRTLRASDPHGRMAKVGFLSARYGFRAADTPVEDYDQRFSQELAARMIRGGMITRLAAAAAPARPRYLRRPPRRGDREPRPLRTGAAQDVALCGGELYLTVMRAHLEGFGEMGCIAGDARVIEINGPIGRMRAALKALLVEPLHERGGADAALR